MFGGQLCNTGGAIYPTGGANAPGGAENAELDIARLDNAAPYRKGGQRGT